MENPLWLKGTFTAGQAWVDLLLLANHKPGTIWKRGIMVEVKRGQVGHSERTLAARWRWSRNRVNRFLRDLKTMQQVEMETEPQNKNVTALISIINYDLYQINGATDGATDGATEGPQKGHKRVQNKNDKNEKNKIYTENALSVLSYLNEKTGKRYRDTSHIEARLNDGGTVEECKKIIDNKLQDPYFIKDNPRLLNPETLFRKGHWDKYLNESVLVMSGSNGGTSLVSCPKCGARILRYDLLPDGGGCQACARSRSSEARA